MGLKSIQYLVFVFIVVLFYFLLQKSNHQKYVLLISDLIFIYMVSNKATLLLILLLCGSIFFIAKQIRKNIDNKRMTLTKIWFWFGFAVDIGLLCYFKFFKNTWLILQEISRSHGYDLQTLIVPIGLSYYSLVLLGYLIDVYHKKFEPEKNILDFINFVLYFPSLFQGPFNLYKKLSPQLKENHIFNYDKFIYGLQRILWGYFKKIIIADRIGIIVSGIFGDEAASGIIIFYAFVIYSFQIYADFSGGIDVIMGVSDILGIEISENFRNPLVSKSVTEFWGRWHMSLGAWMEKYIYYPIVLNRNMMKLSKRINNNYMSKVFSASIATFVVFILVGIWHGTGWNYMVYGLYQSFWCTLAVLLGQFYKKAKKKVKLDENCISWKIFTILRTFNILVIGRYFSRAGSLEQAIDLLRRTFVKKVNIYKLFDGSLYNYGMDYKNFIIMYLGIILLIIVDILHERGIRFRQLINKQDIVFRYFIYLATLFAIIIFGIYGREFNQSSFIYQGF